MIFVLPLHVNSFKREEVNRQDEITSLPTLWAWNYTGDFIIFPTGKIVNKITLPNSTCKFNSNILVFLINLVTV